MSEGRGAPAERPIRDDHLYPIDPHSGESYGDYVQRDTFGLLAEAAPEPAPRHGDGETSGGRRWEHRLLQAFHHIAPWRR